MNHGRASPLLGRDSGASASYGSKVTNLDDLLDADAAAANRRDTRLAVIISAVAVVTILMSGLLVVAGGLVV